MELEQKPATAAVEARMITSAWAPEWVKALTFSSRWLVSAWRWRLLTYTAVIFTLLLSADVIERTPQGGDAWAALIGSRAVFTAGFLIALLAGSAVLTWLYFAAYAAMGRAALWVIDEDSGWASVTASRPRSDERTWSVASLVAIPSRNGRGTRVGEALIAWADEQVVALQATARTDDLARQYERFGFVDQGRTRWGKVRLRRDPTPYGRDHGPFPPSLRRIS